MAVLEVASVMGSSAWMDDDVFRRTMPLYDQTADWLAELRVAIGTGRILRGNGGKKVTQPKTAADILIAHTSLYGAAHGAGAIEEESVQWASDLARTAAPMECAAEGTFSVKFALTWISDKLRVTQPPRVLSLREASFVSTGNGDVSIDAADASDATVSGVAKEEARGVLEAWISLGALRITGRGGEEEEEEDLSVLFSPTRAATAYVTLPPLKWVEAGRTETQKTTSDAAFSVLFRLNVPGIEAGGVHGCYGGLLLRTCKSSSLSLSICLSLSLSLCLSLSLSGHILT